MPYKHIAAHLRKTELACRLHYHQMSYGSNRRRRTDSISSTASSNSSPSSANGQHQQEYIPSAGSHRAVESTRRDSQTLSPQPSNFDSPNQSRTHVPILPKQMSTTLPPIRSVTPPEYSEARNLRLDTSSFSHVQKPRGNDSIDYSLLRRLYDSHRDSFWSLIASEYSKSPGVTGARLEQAFLNSTTVPRDPITPPDSPKSTSSRTLQHPSPSWSEVRRPDAGHSGFCAVNMSPLPSIPEPPTDQDRSSPSDKCSVTSLLTVEKDVWAPKEVLAA